MKKTIFIDRRAEKELKGFTRQIQLKFQAFFEILEQDRKLEEPFGKKLSGKEHLFEIRVKHQGQWRAMYAYKNKETIIILNVFAKKTKKTPIRELEKARKRLLDY